MNLLKFGFFSLQIFNTIYIARFCLLTVMLAVSSTKCEWSSCCFHIRRIDYCSLAKSGKMLANRATPSLICSKNLIYSTMLSGKLDKGAVMKAICSGFQETTDPPVCLSEGKSIPYTSLQGCSFLAILSSLFLFSPRCLFFNSVSRKNALTRMGERTLISMTTYFHMFIKIDKRQIIREVNLLRS